MNYGNSVWLIEGKKILVNNYIASTQKKKTPVLCSFVVVFVIPIFAYRSFIVV